MELFIYKLVSDSVNADHAEVRHIIENAKSGDTFVFSKKEYHFYKECSPSRIVHMTNTDSFKFPEKYFGMLFENLDDIEIQGNGATFVIHGDICAMAFLNCHNVKMSGFTVKYANPNNIEMRVQSINGRKVTFEFPDSTEWRLDGKDFVFSESSPINGENIGSLKMTRTATAAFATAVIPFTGHCMLKAFFISLKKRSRVTILIGYWLHIALSAISKSAIVAQSAKIITAIHAACLSITVQMYQPKTSLSITLPALAGSVKCAVIFRLKMSNFCPKAVAPCRVLPI